MRRSWLRRSLAAIGVAALVVVALTALLHVGYQPPDQRPGEARLATPAPKAAAPAPKAATPTPGAAAPTPGAATSTPGGATPTPTPALTARLTPGTLLIPKIGVRAAIEQVTVDSNNDMASPQKPSDVGWYSPGVAPGQSGDAVIDGHLDWYGVPRAVFYYLGELQAGDEVDVISQGGVELRFQVTSSTLVGRTAHPAGLFSTGGTPRLTLITCAGDWNPTVNEYGERLLVDATLVGSA